MLPYFQHPVRQTTRFPKYPLWVLSLHRLFLSMDCPMPISWFRPYSSFKVQLKSYQRPPPPNTHSLSCFLEERPVHTSLTVLCYGSYNHALNKRENKSAVHIIKCYTNMIPALMASFYLHYSTWSCMRAGITSVTFVSPTVLNTI